jgi:hypothetical protein
VVLVSGQPSEFARLTNLAVRTVFADMINANTVLRNTYGNGLKRICQALLAVGGQKSDWPITLEWNDALPVNDLEEAQIVQLERTMGLISKESAATELGLDWSQELDRMAEESDSNEALMERLITTGGPSPFEINRPGASPEDIAQGPQPNGYAFSPVNSIGGN